MDNQHPNQTIEDLYLIEKKSMLNIAKILNLKYSEVYHYLNQRDLIRRKKKFFDEAFFEELEDLYYNKRCLLNDIAKKLNLRNHKVVTKILLDNNYKLRKTDSEILLDKIGGKEVLFDLYIKQNKSPNEIAKIYSSSLGRINTLIKKFGFVKSEIDKKESWRRNSIKGFREKYNTDFPFQNKENLNFINSKAREKYNVEKNIFQNDEIKNKSKETLIKKYNVNHYSQTAEFKNKIKIKLRENELYKYNELGKIHLSSCEKFKEFLNKNIKKYSLIELSILFGCSTKSLRTIISQSYPKQSFIEVRNKYLKTVESKWETLFKQFLNLNFPDLNYYMNDRSILEGQEIDFFFPDINIGIEINPLYTHKYNEDKNKAGKPFNYHIEKTKKAKSKGVKLIHVWEHDFDDLNLIKYAITSKIKIIKNKYISKDKYSENEITKNYKIIDSLYLYYYLDKKDLKFKSIITKEKLNKINSYGFIVTSGVWEVQRL